MGRPDFSLNSQISTEGQLYGDGIKYTTPLLADGDTGEIIGALITFTHSCI